MLPESISCLLPDNIVYAARFILRHIFSTRLSFFFFFFKPAYADRRDSEVTRAAQIDRRRRHIDTRKCNVSIDGEARRPATTTSTSTTMRLDFGRGLRKGKSERASEAALLTFFSIASLAIGTPPAYPGERDTSASIYGLQIAPNSGCAALTHYCIHPHAVSSLRTHVLSSAHSSMHARSDAVRECTRMTHPTV